MVLLTRRQLKAGIALLFILNFFYLFTYFTEHPIPVSVHFHFHRDDDADADAANNNNNLTSSSSEIRLSTRTGIRRHLPLSTTTTTRTGAASSTSSKPWPILPSFLPWTLDSLGGGPKVGSCEAYFGNGFTRTVDLLPLPRPPPPRKSSSSFSGGGGGVGGGWFRCHHSETLRSSVCEAGMVRMVPDRIRMSKGGEKIGEVLGRDEEDELPDFEQGAFQVAAGDGSRKRSRRKLATKEFLNEFVPTGGVMRHTMRQLVDSFEVVGDSEFQCSEWVEEPTLLLTRYEYANVFHTHTDWYSAYVSSRVTGLPRRPHVVFVDGHCQTKLEETWEALFSSVRFAKNFTGSVCFKHAIIVPLGYETALFKGLSEAIDCQGTSARSLWANPDDSKTVRLSEFGEMIKAAFGFPVERQRNAEPISGNLNILFVRREDYLAHPRHGGRIQSRLSNEQEVFDYVKSWASSNSSACKVNLINGLFAHMPMKEQIQAIQDASIIVGAHGAGLTHMVSALSKTVILEIISSEFMRPHFRLIAQWKGLEYHAINLHGSSADPQVVVERLDGIVKAFQC